MASCQKSTSTGVKTIRVSSRSSCWLGPSSDQQRNCLETEWSFTDTPGQQHEVLTLAAGSLPPHSNARPSCTHSTTLWPLAGSDRRQKHLPGQTGLGAEPFLLWAATDPQHSGQAMPGYHSASSVPSLARPDGWLGSVIGTVELWRGYMLLMAISFCWEQLPLLFQYWSFISGSGKILLQLDQFCWFIEQPPSLKSHSRSEVWGPSKEDDKHHSKVELQPGSSSILWLTPARSVGSSRPEPMFISPLLSIPGLAMEIKDGVRNGISTRGGAAFPVRAQSRATAIVTVRKNCKWKNTLKTHPEKLALSGAPQSLLSTRYLQTLVTVNLRFSATQRCLQLLP